MLITGTVWRPELPDIEKLHKELTEVISMECCVEKAVTLMLWIMRTQPFKDGNKRDEVSVKSGSRVSIINNPACETEFTGWTVNGNLFDSSKQEREADSPSQV